MKIATVKSLATKFAITSLAVGAFFLASPAKSQAQQFAVSARFGQPVYVGDHDGYRNRDDFRQRERDPREREAREAYTPPSGLSPASSSGSAPHSFESRLHELPLSVRCDGLHRCNTVSPTLYVEPRT